MIATYIASFGRPKLPAPPTAPRDVPDSPAQVMDKASENIQTRESTRAQTGKTAAKRVSFTPPAEDKAARGNPPGTRARPPSPPAAPPPSVALSVHATPPATVNAEGFYSARAARVLPDDGHILAFALMASRLGGDPKRTRVPLVLTQAELEAAKAPTTEVPFFTELSRDSEAEWAAAEEAFVASLPTGHDREAFAAGRRLLPGKRRELLEMMSKGQRTAAGLRFADEPSPFRDSPGKRELRRHPSVPVTPRLPPNGRRVLMLLWWFADPLLLDHTVDVWTNGANLAYNGKYVNDLNKNMVRSKADLREAADLLLKEISAGRSTGLFSEPPFPKVRLIPFGLVPKKDGTKRPVENFSAGHATSVNGLSDTMVRDAPPFNKAVVALDSAGADGRLVCWDVEKAFNTHKPRPECQWLTCLRFPASAFAHRQEAVENLRWPPGTPESERWVYAYRTAMPFGNRTSGYRWEVNGGRSLITTYMVIQHRLHAHSANPDREMRLCLLPQLSFSRPHGRADPLWIPANGRGDLSGGDDSILCPLGRRRLNMLRELHAPTFSRTPANVRLEPIARNTDDFLAGYSDAQLAARSAAAVVYVHAAINIPLKRDKFSHVARACDFHGFDFVVPCTISYAQEKRDVLCDRLQLLLAPSPSFHDVQSAVGTAIYMITMYSQLRGTIGPLYELLAEHNVHAASSRVRKRTLVTLRVEVRAVVRMLLRIVKSGPTSTSTCVRTDSLSDRATVVAHADYATSTRACAFAVLSHARFGSAVCTPKTHKRWGLSLPTMEALAVLLFLVAFGPTCGHCVVVVFTDNIPLIQAYERFYAKKVCAASSGLSAVLRLIAETLVAHSIVLHLERVPSARNFSDQVSRLCPDQAFQASMRSRGYAVPFSRMSLPSPSILPEHATSIWM